MNAAHLHLITNHVPLFGLIAALALLLWGMWRGSFELRLAAYAAFVLSGIAAAVAYFTGNAAETIVEDLPGIAEATIERHQDAATIALVLVCLSGIAGIVALFSEYRKLALRKAALSLVLTIGLLALGAVGYAASLGGFIHHTEISAHR